ncbi:adenylate/guanylate cyclase domain-containing protein [Noviherbaspirillum sp.]|uniref:CHASE2 domain-containing protein n=1 Tax=Noviherbaspirillum sp. TaxID=1926288 RepID=UPI002B4A3991|nr:adenylate/guanylate cyclase domain-containing protein [Noviherbaspirillum sp.]HJV83387.1 adenylate/guanylate cyclase domain-containing protein [Noviherbaspirillum sp.]
MRRHLSRYGARWLLALIFTLIAALQILHFLPTILIGRIDDFIYDMRMRVQQGELDPRIVIVDIDEKSIAEVGRWPWNRATVASLIEKLDDKYHVRTVGFDVIFSEPDTSSGYNTLESLANKELKDVPGFGERVRALKPRFDYDKRMAMALDGRPVVLGYFLSNEPTAIIKGLLPPPVFTVEQLGGREIDVSVYRSYTGNLDVLQEAARGGGFMNPTPDLDGVIRRVPLIAQVGDGFYESLALATARAGLGASRVKPVFFTAEETHLSGDTLREYGALKAIKLNSKPHTTTIPLDRNLTALINYRGPGGPRGGQFRYVSAIDVLKERLPVDDLADRIILVGTTSAGLKDLRAAPVNIDYPGVEMHANIIASILDGDFKQEPDFGVALELVETALVGIVLGLLLPVLSPLMSILVSFATIAGVLGLNLYMYQSLNWVVSVAAVLLLIGSLFIFSLAWGYLFEFRKSRAMVNLFGEYVAPELVAEMAENPESYNMEGESRELTVLFCDVRGFTTISEGLTPNALREYINLYLTAMSEDIRGNRGTLDKYIGDAVMAFWGAPVALPDHASRAVATALQMQASAKKLNQDFTARGWPPLKIGVGLNTGEMRVGDMGSKIRRAYTVMGDAVNLSSRLEGITKVYGVGIAVGEATRLAAPQFAYRELDRVRVKGKNEPVPIFEPLGRMSELDDATHGALDKWHKALELVRAQQWDLAEQHLRELHEMYPDTALYMLYLERIAHYRDVPPGADWDGVTTFETK